jgi:hypothetical protein
MSLREMMGKHGTLIWSKIDPSKFIDLILLILILTSTDPQVHSESTTATEINFCCPLSENQPTPTHFVQITAQFIQTPLEGSPQSNIPSTNCLPSGTIGVPQRQISCQCLTKFQLFAFSVSTLDMYMRDMGSTPIQHNIFYGVSQIMDSYLECLVTFSIG